MSMTQAQPENPQSSADFHEITAAHSHLVEWLKENFIEGRAYELVRALAEVCLAVAERGDAPRIPFSMVKEKLTDQGREKPQTQEHAVAWRRVEDFWAAARTRYLESCATKGLPPLRPVKIPAPPGARSALYQFEIEPTERRSPELRLDGSEVIYTRERIDPQHLLPWTRLVMPNGSIKLCSLHGIVFYAPVVIGVLFAGLAVIFAHTYLVLSLQEPRFIIASLTIASLVPVLILTGLGQSWRLLMDRIILSRGVWVKWSQAEHQFEAARDGSDCRYIHIVRYTAPCPICSSTVELASGKRQFPGRIVGRCRESPVEHVFSFDRITREGAPLVARLRHPHG